MSGSSLTHDMRALLRAPNLAHVATLLEDGAPHVVPTWISTEGDRVVFLTSPESVKAQNLERDPRVAISITAVDEPLHRAHIRGHVTEIIDGDRGWSIIDRMSDDYTGEPYALRSDRVVFAVSVDHAWSKSTP